MAEGAPPRKRRNPTQVVNDFNEAGGTRRQQGIKERADKKPCPWCNTVSGFEIDTGKEALANLPGVGMRFLGVVLQPHVAFKGVGIERVCKSCRGHAGLCPHCDTPNRQIGMTSKCSSCEARFVF